MSTKLEAIQNGRPTFNTGKPCKRGHHSDRYTSNGMCIECVRQQNNAAKEVAKVAKIRHNQALAANLQPRTFMVGERDREIVQRVCDIFQYGTPGLREEITDHINRIYDVCPHPRSLSYEGLLTFIRWADGKIHNPDQLQLIYPVEGGNDPNTYIVRNGLFYRATEVLEVLRGQRLTVIPRTPMF